MASQLPDKPQWGNPAIVPNVLSLSHSASALSTQCMQQVDHTLLSYLIGSIFFFFGISKLLDTENQPKSPVHSWEVKNRMLWKLWSPVRSQSSNGNEARTSCGSHGAFLGKFISILSVAYKALLDLAPAFFPRLSWSFPPTHTLRCPWSSFYRKSSQVFPRLGTFSSLTCLIPPSGFILLVTSSRKPPLSMACPILLCTLTMIIFLIKLIFSSGNHSMLARDSLWLFPSPLPVQFSRVNFFVVTVYQASVPGAILSTRGTVSNKWDRRGPRSKRLFPFSILLLLPPYRQHAYNYFLIYQ